MIAKAATTMLKAASVCAGAAIVILMLLTVVDVFQRQFLNGGVRGVIEITEVALVAVVFAGMVSAELARRHVRTPVVLNVLPNRPAAALRLVGLVLSAAMTTWITIVTAETAVRSVEAGEARFGLLEVPVWPARVLIPIGMAGFCLVLVVRAVALGRALVEGSVVEEKVRVEDVF